MKLTELNETLSLVANIGVLLGLVFLILEIQQNTRAIENDAFWSRVNSSQAVNSLIVENEDVAELMVEFLQDANVMQNPLTTDKLRIRKLFEMVATQSEARFVTNSDNLKALESTLSTFFLNPGLREAFKARMSLFTPEFAAFVSEIMNQDEGVE